MKNQFSNIALFSNNKAAIMTYNQNGISNILNEDICLPIVVINETVLDNNIKWMQNYADQCKVSLAPHGKTTMTPAIFKKQIKAGAWGISVGTAYQAKVAVDTGIKNIIIANQLIGKANIRFISELKKQHSINIYCCVDNKENVEQLSDYFVSQNQKMNVLLELGLPGERCGCRTIDDAIVLAKYIHSLPGLQLSGVEFYEGVIHSLNEQADIEKINSFLEHIFTVTQKIIEENLFGTDSELILTGAGSVWYDIICQKMQQIQLTNNIRYVIRPGCYVTLDKGIYSQSHEALKKRNQLACELNGDLTSALELCAFVQSMPERQLAIIGFGKRDVAFDEGLPQPIAHYRNGNRMPFIMGKMTTKKIMDQHAMLNYEDDVDLKVGDILIFGTSHPCITFDKWRQIYFVDDDYNVIESIETYF